LENSDLGFQDEVPAGGRLNSSRTPPASPLTFRGLRGEVDYPLLADLVRESRQADRIPDAVSVTIIAQSYAPNDHFDPARQVLIAELAGTAIGYSRLGWYSSAADNRLYYQISYLRPQYRELGYWPAMVRQNDSRLRELAATHSPRPVHFLQAWATDAQKEWMAALESEGYQIVRRFNNMLHPLTSIPVKPLPAGFELRPVQPEHFRAIWEAQKEMNQGMFENADEDWTEDQYPAWLEAAQRTSALWQVAWAGDQLAGMVLARIDAAQNAERGQKRGYTEHIYVRRPWRQQGLAGALIVRALQMLRAQGMEEAELGVDADNESAAYRLYESLGYKTYYVDLWWRKAMV
jgi:ribosomal protein S18 acetylase RimI-like enzyme